MRKCVLLIVILFHTLSATAGNIAIAIHGGAGTLKKETMSSDQQSKYHAALEQALQQGYRVLEQGGSSVDSVQAAIVSMEDSPLFNAGYGAVFTHDKTHELDASIMEGKNLNAGAVTGVSHIKNPIVLAAAVMQQSEHVMFSGEGAERFARTQNIPRVGNDYFSTERRLKQIEQILEREASKTKLSEDQAKLSPGSAALWEDRKFGTVGAVALDAAGNLAAATSTGGMSNKQYGRIGDSPVIGAGTYADNRACAVSATGHGEYFIRAAVTHDICARVLYKGITLQQAADEVIQGKLIQMNGRGGVVALSPKGEVVFSFNTSGMYRGYIDSKGARHTEIFK